MCELMKLWIIQDRRCLGLRMCGTRRIARVTYSDNRLLGYRPTTHKSLMCFHCSLPLLTVIILFWCQLFSVLCSSTAILVVTVNFYCLLFEVGDFYFTIWSVSLVVLYKANCRAIKDLPLFYIARNIHTSMSTIIYLFYLLSPFHCDSTLNKKTNKSTCFLNYFFSVPFVLTVHCVILRDMCEQFDTCYKTRSIQAVIKWNVVRLTSEGHRLPH